MADKSKQPLASSFFQPISQDDYKVYLRHTIPIGILLLPPISKKEKCKEERIHNNPKMRASQDHKKTKKVIKGKRDLERHSIK